MDAREWDVGSEAGVLACYDAATDEVYRYARRIAGDPDVARDLLQDAFLELVRQARAGSIERVSVGWLITAVRHRYLNTVRADNRERRRLELVSARLAPDDEPGDLPDELLAPMSERERVAVVLRYVDGLSVREVGDELGLGVRATESLLARAKARVRRGEVRDA
jgi:RNA polymerase sigma-70 factor (ECF subfamily)